MELLKAIGVRSCIHTLIVLFTDFEQGYNAAFRTVNDARSAVFRRHRLMAEFFHDAFHAHQLGRGIINNQDAGHQVLQFDGLYARRLRRAQASVTI